MATGVFSAVCDAMETVVARIESGFTRGYAGMQLIGNTSEICRDGKERARAALEGIGLVIPPSAFSSVSRRPTSKRTATSSIFPLPSAWDFC